MKKVNFILFAIIFYVSSCSNPTNSAKGIIEKAVLEQSQGHLKLINFTKKDLVNLNVNGLEICEIQYECEAECIKDNAKVYTPDGTTLQRFNLEPPQKSYMGMYMYDNTDANTPLAIGRHYKHSGKITIEKHEQGWVATNFF